MTLFDELEADMDIDVADYDLKPSHAVVNCRCGRLLLARRHMGERQPAYAVTDADVLPPVQFGWRVAVVDGRPHRVPECVQCYRDRTGRAPKVSA